MFLVIRQFPVLFYVYEYVAVLFIFKKLNGSVFLCNIRCFFAYAFKLVNYIAQLRKYFSTPLALSLDKCFYVNLTYFSFLCYYKLVQEEPEDLLYTRPVCK